MNDKKDSNPKEAVGQTKVPTGLVPDSALVELALAFAEGALKYGRYNWRIAGVRASTYNDAMDRHRKKWWNGEDADPITRVKHLASIMACAAIVLDAELLKMLNDDRPPRAPVSELLDSKDVLERFAHLKKIFEANNPRQWTIKDAPNLKKIFEANNPRQWTIKDAPEE